MTEWEALYRYTNPEISEGAPGRSWTNKLPVAYFDKDGIGWVSAASHEKTPGHLRPATDVRFAGWEFRGYYPVRRVIAAIPGGGWTAMYGDGGGEEGGDGYGSLLVAWLVYDDGEIKPMDAGSDGYVDDPTGMANFLRLDEPGAQTKRIDELEARLVELGNGQDGV